MNVYKNWGLMKDQFEQDRDTLGYWFQLDEEMKIGVIAESEIISVILLTFITADGLFDLNLLK